MSNYQYTICLTPAERQELEQLVHRGSAPARALLLPDQSQGQRCTNQGIAEAVFCAEGTVINVRRRFQEGGLTAALCDRERPGALPKWCNLRLLTAMQPA